VGESVRSIDENTREVCESRRLSWKVSAELLIVPWNLWKLQQVRNFVMPLRAFCSRAREKSFTSTETSWWKTSSPVFVSAPSSAPTVSQEEDHKHFIIVSNAFLITLPSPQKLGREAYDEARASQKSKTHIVCLISFVRLTSRGITAGRRSGRLMHVSIIDGSCH
jgi:hypothetical protein